MREIGGYFQLEFKKGNSFHPNAIALNTARNCFEYILRAKSIKKVLIPHYTCDVMLEPIKKLGVDFEFYNIDSNLEPILSTDNPKTIPVLYTNYFGVKQAFIEKVSVETENLIIDNSQGFYYPKAGNKDTFYSARKFFGVPDGSYLFTHKYLPAEEIDVDTSYQRISHLIKRIELGSNVAYKDFLENDFTLYNQPMKHMSKFTQTVLASIDYDLSKMTRERNFLYLHNLLATKNEFNINLDALSGPMCYPFLFKKSGLRAALLENKIYVPFLWKNVFVTTRKGDFERYLADYMFCLPVDQRYDIDDLKYILSVLNRFL